MTTTEEKMTFEDFKNSFFYGDRSNMNFKFLSHLSEAQAASFFQELLQELGSTINDGNVERLMSLVVDWQTKGYAHQKNFDYYEGPFTPLDRGVDQTKVGLLTSSGHFVQGEDPEPLGVKAMTQKQAEDRIKDFLKAEPQLSVIPSDTPIDRLVVRHGGYDICGSADDPNVTFPLALLRRLAKEGKIGKLAQEVYSFVGACSQTRLLKHNGPLWVQRMKEQGVQAALLVPV
jgi:hypothetical protein